MKKKFLKGILCVAAVGTLLCACNNNVPAETREHQHFVTEVCRKMITLYEFDYVVYERYKCSDDVIEQSLAEDAKLIANQTAETYNDYVNKYESLLENVSEDIYAELEIIE